MLSVEQLYSVALDMADKSKTNKLEEVFSSVGDEKIMLSGLQRFLRLIDDAVLEVEACQFRREDKQVRFLSELRNFRAKLLERLVLRDRGSVGLIFPMDDVERLGAISEVVTETLDGSNTPVDRQSFAEATSTLIEDIRNWDIEDFPKRSLLLSLNLVVAQSNVNATSVSDSDIRRRIKAIVADFCVEFVSLDKEFETKFEKIRRWARLGYEGATTPLGLTSQAASIAGLLPKPS